jgi:hypothetical protein
LNSGFEALIVLGRKAALAYQSAQSRDQLGYNEDIDPRVSAVAQKVLTSSDPSSST